MTHSQSLLVLALTALTPACNTFCTTGSGNVVTETRTVGEFSGLKIDNSIDVVGTPLAAGTLELEADDNLAPLIVTEVRGGVLVIDTVPNTCISTSSDLRIRVSLEGVESILIDGSGDVLCEQPLHGERLAVSIDGSGDVRLTDIDVGQLETLIDGSGDVEYAGRAVHHDIEIDGSGDVEASVLATESTEVEVDGSGTSRISVEQELVVSIDGSGDVEYSGDPGKVSLDIDGSGSIARAQAR